MTDLITYLKRAFYYVENMGGNHPGFALHTVGSVFLSSEDAAILRKRHRDDFEPLPTPPDVVGVLWGARVRVSDKLKTGEIVILQDGIHADIFDGVAGVPLEFFPHIPGDFTCRNDRCTAFEVPTPGNKRGACIFCTTPLSETKPPV